MGKHTPLFAGKRTAAQLLDMRLGDFLDLVACGALPKPVNIGGKFVRWSVKDLEAIRTGKAMDDKFQW